MISICASKRCPYSRLVRGVEALRELLDPGVVDRSGRHLEAHLVALAGVAAVREPPDEPLVLGHAVGLELGDRLRDELVEARLESRVSSSALQRVALRGDELVLQVGGEQAGRGDDAGIGRHEHARDLELQRDVAREQRARAAGRDERELARVVAAAHRVQLDRLRHPVLLDLQGAERGLLDRHAEPIGDLWTARLRELEIELHGAAEQAPVGPQAAEHELGVGRGRDRCPRVRSRRARGPPRGLRPDAEHTALVDVGDRPAAGADRVDVDHGHHRLVVADLRVEQVAHA